MSFPIALLLGLARLAAPGSLHAQEAIPGAQPVPPEYLRGTTLTVPDLDFSVEAPGPTWRWSRSSSASGSITQTIFFCHEPETDVRYIVSVLPLEGSFDGRTMEQFLRGLAASIEKNGRTVLDARHETATLPRPGSFRYRYTARGPGRPTVYGEGYVVPADRLYVLQAASATPDEPESFGRFVRSFRLLKEPAGARAGARLGAGVGYLVVTLLCLAVGWVVNRLAGRPVFNGGLVAVAVVGPVVAARLVVLALGGMRAGLAEALGTVVGEGAIALAIGGIAWRRFHRQKAAWRAGKPVVADPRPTP